jgi:transcriptional regulator with XRE-family HTH domain
MTDAGSRPTRTMLGVLLRAWREHRRMGLRETAKIIGISHATLSRIENGKPTNGVILWKVLTWLNSSEQRK